MESFLNDLSNEDSVRVAIKENWLSYHYHLWNAASAELGIGPYVTWFVTDIPDHFMNVVVCASIPGEVIEPVFEEALAHFRQLNVTRVSWLVEEMVQEQAVKEHLLARGLVMRDSFAVNMAADLRSLPESLSLPDGLEIVSVRDRQTLEQWIHVASLGFGVAEKNEKAWCELFDDIVFSPPFTTYLALLNGRPVATGQLFAYIGVAGVYNISCLPEVRGQGVGTAMTMAPLLDARKLGYRVGILQASKLGMNVYRKLGFQEFGKLSVLTWEQK